MKKFFSIGFTSSLIFLACFTMLENWYNPPWLADVLTYLSYTTLLCALFNLTIRQAIIPYFLCVISLGIFSLNTDVTRIHEFLKGITEMRGIVLVLLVVPLIGLVLNSKPYVFSIIIYCSRFLKTTCQFHMGLMMATQMVSFFLLPASVPVIYQFVSHFQVKENRELWKYLKSIAILRGFALTGVWSLSIPSFIYAVEILGASVLKTMIIGFFLSFIGILLSTLFFFFYKREDSKRLTIEMETIIHKIAKNNQNNKIFFEFLLLFFSLLSSILILNYLVPWGILRIIPIVIVFWTLAYFLINKKYHDFVLESKEFFNNVPLKCKEISIFLSSGLLISSLTISGIGKKIVEGSYYLVDPLVFVNYLMILPLFVILFSFIGIPATASMVIICSILQTLPLSYTPELIVIALATGTVGGILLSPFMIPGILLSNVNKNIPYQNTLSKNKVYTISFLVLAQIYIQMIILVF